MIWLLSFLETVSSNELTFQDVFMNALTEL